MKYLYWLVLVLFPTAALAQIVQQAAPVAPYTPPVWIEQVLTWISTLPKVGPIVMLILTVLAVVCTLMTALATFLLTVKASIQGIAKLSGAVALIDKVEAVYQKIAPYVMYLSMYNAPKKTDPPKS